MAAGMMTQPKRSDAATGKSAAALYADREKRLLDTISLKQPDRLPTIFFSHFWVGRYSGMTCRQTMYDYAGLKAAMIKAVVDLEPDSYYPGQNIMAFGPTMDILDYQQLEWPGSRGLPENVPFQYLDREYMTAAEYDEYLQDPTGFMLHRYLPRVANAFKPMELLPQYPSVLHTRILQAVQAYANPAVREMFTTLIRAGEEMQKMLASADEMVKELTELGFPLGNHATSHAPFDVASDYLRGSKGAMLDMFRNKDKLQATLDRITQLIPANGIATARRNNGRYIFFPLHWGLDGFMSPVQFKTYYWPPLRQVMMTMIEQGFIPQVLWEGDCTTRLEVIADLPPGKAVYMFERTDMKKAKKILGQSVCIRGNVPVSILITGSVQDTRDAVKKLFDDCGEGGGFILDGGVGIPDEAKPENVIAMFELAKELTY
jgi:uroporphyrinogen-III decarboxylase